MRYVGIDIASETHVVAAVDEQGKAVVKPTEFTEDAEGYTRLMGLLAEPADTLIAMEATGHYWKNLFAELATRGFRVALLNPLRTHHFAGEQMQRTKTDAIDALGIARFAAQKRPRATSLPDQATEELRELVRYRDRLVQDLGDRVRQLHRLVDLGFPEFTRHVKTLDSELACAILREFPTAEAFQNIDLRRLAGLRYDNRHKVGEVLAQAILDAARSSVGRHHGLAYRVQIVFICDDIGTLRKRIKQLKRDIDTKLSDSDVGTLLTTIDGIGSQTAARLVAELGDPAGFDSAAALAAFVGVVPAIRQSGKSKSNRAGISNLGHVKLRSALWMPTLVAVRKNPWLKAFYERMRASGKRPKVALIAAMHKLLLAVYSVAKNRRPFVPHVRAPGTPT